jgi:hypothetical protein
MPSGIRNCSRGKQNTGKRRLMGQWHVDVLSRSADAPQWNYCTSAESFCIERPHGPVFEG